MRSPYDKATIARLVSRHGFDHAKLIIAGTDKATNADIAAWRTLGLRKPKQAGRR